MQEAWQAQQNELDRQSRLAQIQASQGGAGGIASTDVPYYQKAAQAAGIAPTQYAMITADPAFQRARAQVGQWGDNTGAQMQMVRHISQRYGIGNDAAMKLLNTPNASPYTPMQVHGYWGTNRAYTTGG